MASRNTLFRSIYASGDKIPVINPVLDKNFACLRYDRLPKVMKKNKPPSWFYASHSTGILPDLQLSKPIRTSEMRAEMERLDRIHEWLRSSYVSPVEVTRSSPPQIQNHYNSNKNNSNNLTKGSISDSQDTKSNSATLPKLKTKEKTIIESLDPNFSSKFPKLGSIMAASNEPEIVGTRVSVRARDNDWRKKKSGTSTSSSEKMQMKDRVSEFYPNKVLPRETTAKEYEEKRSRTFYGLDNSFTSTNASHHPLRRQVGPIQRPHTPPAPDLFVRQRTRYGDTMMHAKSPSRAFAEQQGKTYMLHAKLKDMLLER